MMKTNTAKETENLCRLEGTFHRFGVVVSKTRILPISLIFFRKILVKLSKYRTKTQNSLLQKPLPRFQPIKYGIPAE
jgi:hypothetical protein